MLNADQTVTNTGGSRKSGRSRSGGCWIFGVRLRNQYLESRIYKPQGTRCFCNAIIVEAALFAQLIDYSLQSPATQTARACCKATLAEYRTILSGGSARRPRSSGRWFMDINRQVRNIVFQGRTFSDASIGVEGLNLNGYCTKKITIWARPAPNRHNAGKLHCQR